MINLTIQGTDRAIEIIDIANNTLVSSNTSEYNLIPYNNYLIKFGEIHTNLTLNSIKLTQNKVVDDVIFIAIIIILFICALAFIKFTRKL